jgi:hypothetical protein
MDHDFADQRVVERRDPLATSDPRINSHTLTLGPLNVLKDARARSKVVKRYLCVNSGFDCRTQWLWSSKSLQNVRRNSELTAMFVVGLLQHQVNQINSVAQFRNSVFDLEACVHLEKEEFGRFIVHEKLDGPYTLVVELGCIVDGRLKHLLA